MPRWTLPLFACVFAALPLTAKESAAPDPWQTALAFDYNVAAERFASLHAANPADTRVAIAYASSLLVKQPRTESNIRTAHDLLLSTAASPTPTSRDDSVLAVYLLARIELDHFDPAQPDSARARLEQLHRDHPSHPIADHAAVELAYLLAYPVSGPDVSALPEIQTLLASVKNPEAARDLHALLASFHLRESPDPRAALKHLLAARVVGFEQPLRNAETDLSIGNLAREIGDLPLAMRHYAAFVAAAPRDVRASTVRRLLKTLVDRPTTAP